MFHIERIEDERQYFWSDLHLRHDRPFILNPRGKADSRQHDQEVEAAINDTVPEMGTLWLLGDTVFGQNADIYLADFLRRIRPKKVILMPGNHHSGLRQLYRSSGREFYLGDTFIRIVPNYFEADVCGQFIILSHYAIASWRDAGKGSWMLHGHSHGNLMRSPIAKDLYAGRIKDVGVEVCPKPISFEQLRAEMEAKPIVSLDHHGRSATPSSYYSRDSIHEGSRPKS